MNGSCACGAVTFEVAGATGGVVICHCSKCRRWHGHTGAYASFVRSQFKLVEARGLAWFQASAEDRRGFCRECGSSVLYESTKHPTRISVCAGVLDGPTGLTTVAHIYVGSKGDYYPAPTDAPAHDTLPARTTKP